MKRANVRLLKKLLRRSLPEPEPDMTGWTSMERLAWELKRHGLAEMIRRANESDEPVLPEAADARDAEDEAILAERAAKAATEALGRHPTNAKAQQAARETREAADEAAKIATEARSVATAAARRPKPQPPACASQALPEAPTPGIGPTNVPPSPTPAKPRRRREPKPKPQWWEERAHWRTRGPADDDEHRGRPLYECIHEYDPLTYDDED